MPISPNEEEKLELTEDHLTKPSKDYKVSSPKRTKMEAEGSRNNRDAGIFEDGSVSKRSASFRMSNSKGKDHQFKRKSYRTPGLDVQVENPIYEQFFDEMDQRMKSTLDSNIQELQSFLTASRETNELGDFEYKFSDYLNLASIRARSEISRTIDQLEKYLMSLVKPTDFETRDLGMDEYLAMNNLQTQPVQDQPLAFDHFNKIRKSLYEELDRLKKERMNVLVSKFEAGMQEQRRLGFQFLKNKLRKDNNPIIKTSEDDRTGLKAIQEVIQIQNQQNIEESDFLLKLQGSIDLLKVRMKKLS